MSRAASRLLLQRLRQCMTNTGWWAKGSQQGQGAAHAALTGTFKGRTTWSSLHQRDLRSLAGLAAAAAFAAAPVAAFAGNEQLEPGALQDLVRNLQDGSSSDREAAVALLSGLTIWIEHHDAMLAAGILQALLRTVEDETTVPQVRVIALDCTAHLLKSQQSHGVAIADQRFLATLQAVLKGEDRWSEGPEDGGTARTAAARCAAELAGDGATHAALVESGLAEMLAIKAAELAAESAERNATYSSMREVPGNLIDVNAVEEERYLAAALFGLAGSPAGRGVIAKHPAAIRGTAAWATSNDPILTRYGVGALARLATADAAVAATVADAGGLRALISALGSADGQAQCYAAKAIGALASSGGAPAQQLLQFGAPEQLLAALEKDNSGTPDGVRQGAYRCLLSAVVHAAQNPEFRSALNGASAAIRVQALLDAGTFQTDDARSEAVAALKAVGGPTAQ